MSWVQFVSSQPNRTTIFYEYIRYSTQTTPFVNPPEFSEGDNCATEGLWRGLGGSAGVIDCVITVCETTDSVLVNFIHLKI